jgi:cruciform cutting endonuclease 1
MGIRNLALCTFNFTNYARPEITSWERVVVSEKPSPESGIMESFEPSDFAPKAYEVIKSVLTDPTPQTILIERQRHRSAGSSAVQEWTLRVNMLEAMFHAILCTLQKERSYPQGGHFVVYSVSPRRMSQYWLTGMGDKMSSRGKKLAKIAIAEELLVRKEVLVTGGAKQLAQGFEGSGMGSKFDDLADSMLQGLGWWKWQVNRREVVSEIMKSGKTHLLDTMKKRKGAIETEKAKTGKSMKKRSSGRAPETKLPMAGPCTI